MRAPSGVTTWRTAIRVGAPSTVAVVHTSGATVITTGGGVGAGVGVRRGRRTTGAVAGAWGGVTSCCCTSSPGSGGVSAAANQIEGRYALSWADNIWADALAL